MELLALAAIEFSNKNTLKPLQGKRQQLSFQEQNPF